MSFSNIWTETVASTELPISSGPVIGLACAAFETSMRNISSNFVNRTLSDGFVALPHATRYSGITTRALLYIRFIRLLPRGTGLTMRDGKAKALQRKA